VQSRVGRARERLRTRLARRGWLPASTPLIDLLEQHVSPLAGVSPALIYATVNVALLAALGKVLTGVVSSSVLEMMNDTVYFLRWSRLRYLAILAVLALLGGVAVAGGVYSLQSHQGTNSTAGQPASSCHGPSTSPGP
jgi:hypothetical protein